MNETRKIQIKRLEDISDAAVSDNLYKIIDKLNILRNSMFRCNAIGIDTETGIPYGNLSARLDGKRFLCTATGTSRFKDIGINEYTIIENYNEDDNTLLYSNIFSDVKPSVEASTHDGIYRGNSNINCIAHGHLQAIYFHYLYNKNKALILDNVEYGSQELRQKAIENSKLLLSPSIPEERNYLVQKGKYGIMIPKKHFGAFFIAGETIEDTLEGFLFAFRDSSIGMLNSVNRELASL